MSGPVLFAKGFNSETVLLKAFVRAFLKIKFAQNINTSHLSLALCLQTGKQVSIFPSLKIKVAFYASYQFYQYFIFIKLAQYSFQHLYLDGSL